MSAGVPRRARLRWDRVLLACGALLLGTALVLAVYGKVAGKQPQRDVFAYFVSTDKPNAPVNALGIQQRLNITAASG